MKDRYDLDSAYSDGFEQGSAGLLNDNPYNPNTERELYDAYESGFVDGEESAA